MEGHGRPSCGPVDGDWAVIPVTYPIRPDPGSLARADRPGGTGGSRPGLLPSPSRDARSKDRRCTGPRAVGSRAGPPGVASREDGDHADEAPPRGDRHRRWSARRRGRRSRPRRRGAAGAQSARPDVLPRLIRPPRGRGPAGESGPPSPGGVRVGPPVEQEPDDGDVAHRRGPVERAVRARRPAFGSGARGRAASARSPAGPSSRPTPGASRLRTTRHGAGVEGDAVGQQARRSPTTRPERPRSGGPRELVVAIGLAAGVAKEPVDGRVVVHRGRLQRCRIAHDAAGRELASAPAARSRLTTSAFPTKAALIRGVLPLSSRASG